MVGSGLHIERIYEKEMGLCAVASCNSVDASRMCSPFDSAVGSISVMALRGQGHEPDFGGKGCFAWKNVDF